MSNSSEENQKLQSLNEALKMLQQNYKALQIINNISKVKIIQDVEKIGKPTEHIYIDITGELNNIEFQTADYNFVGVNLNNPLEIYMRLKERYIIPLLNGFDTYEEFEFSKLSEEEQLDVMCSIGQVF